MDSRPSAGELGPSHCAVPIIFVENFLSDLHDRTLLAKLDETADDGVLLRVVQQRVLPCDCVLVSPFSRHGTNPFRDQQLVQIVAAEAKQFLMRDECPTSDIARADSLFGNQVRDGPGRKRQLVSSVLFGVEKTGCGTFWVVWHCQILAIQSSSQKELPVDNPRIT
jgi:hypothetical protein